MTGLLLAIWAISITALSQNDFDSTKIKLFINFPTVEESNPNLTPDFQNRLFQKITQMANKSGVVESGFSNFLIIPKLDSIGITVDEAGIGKIYLAEYELTITIERRSYSKLGAATFHSYSKKVIGSGMNEREAVLNVINSITANDREWTAFFREARQKIYNYYQLHCKDVIDEAVQASKLNNYAQTIALSISIPPSSPCHSKGQELALSVYSKYATELCNKTLLKLKAYMARAHNTDKIANEYYRDVIAIIEEADPSNPSSSSCYSEMLSEIRKMETRFDDKQKKDWELKLRVLTTPEEVKNNRRKLMDNLSKKYSLSKEDE